MTQEKEEYYLKNSIHNRDTYNDIEPLSKNDIQQIFNMIASNYDHCTKEVQYIIGGLAINIQKMSISGNNTESDLIDLGNDGMNSHETIVHLTKKSIRQYQTIFTPKRNLFLWGEDVICIEKLNQKNITTQSKLWLKSQREKSICKKKL